MWTDLIVCLYPIPIAIRIRSGTGTDCNHVKKC
jgi:hypothetical protein